MTTKNNVDYNDVKELLELSNNLELEIDCYEDVLLDHYVIYSNKKINVNGKCSDFIICEVCFVNSWTSNYKIILTDDCNEVEDFVKRFEIEEE